jgi:DNA-binding NarL/FixJ family response regulator
MPQGANSFELTEPDKGQLREWATAFGTPQQVALRCRIVLAAAEGLSDYEVAAKLQSNRKTVMLWRRRFVQEGEMPCGR